MSKFINALITIDTDRVKKDYPNPSLVSTSPTAIGPSYAFMVASGATKIENQGSWSLKFKAVVGDGLRAFAASASDNFEDDVLIYGFKVSTPGAKKVTSEFSYESYNKSAVAGKLNTPPHCEDRKFTFFEAKVIDTGTVTYNVNFALYTRNDNGTPELKGYYYWDPTIEVLG